MTCLLFHTRHWHAEVGLMLCFGFSIDKVAVSLMVGPFIIEYIL